MKKNLIFINIFLHLELKAMKYENSKYNIVLNDMDSIHISSKLDSITITGAFLTLNKRQFLYHMERRANFYINNYAGGFTKHNVKTPWLYPLLEKLQKQGFWFVYFVSSCKNGVYYKIN